MINALSLLTAQADGAASGGMGIGFIIVYILFFVVLIYFMFFKPQKKQAAAQEEMMSKLKPGCSIMTTSGFYGTVIGVDEDTVIVEFGNNKNCRIPMHKKAIAEVESPDDVVEEEPEEEEKVSKLGKSKK